MALTEAGAAVIAGLGSAAIGAGTQIGTAMRSLKKNKAFAQYQYDLNMQAWREQMAYNTPAAQMQRLVEAGLNPNLVYGNGNVANQADSPPQYEAPRADLTTEVDMSRHIAAGLNLAMSSLQARSIEADIASKRQAMLESAERTAGQAIKNAQGQFDLDLAKDLRENTLEASRLNLESIRSGIDRQTSEIALNDVRSGYFRSQQKLADAQVKRLETLTPAEYENIKARTGLTRTQITDLRIGWSKISQDLKEGRSRMALQRAEYYVKRFQIDQWERGRNPSITNPLSMLLDYVNNTTNGNSPDPYGYGAEYEDFLSGNFKP